MSPEEALISLVMSSLAPSGDVPALAHAIATSGATWDEATWLVAVAFREGSNRLGVIGDQGRARCVFQLHAAPVEVLTSAEACTRIALRRLRASARLCPSRPLAAYAGALCDSDTAGRISRDRDRVRRRAFARLGAVLP